MPTVAALLRGVFSPEQRKKETKRKKKKKKKNEWQRKIRRTLESHGRCPGCPCRVGSVYAFLINVTAKKRGAKLMPLRNTNHDSNRLDWSWAFGWRKFQRWIVGLFVEISVGPAALWNLSDFSKKSWIPTYVASYSEGINTVPLFSIFSSSRYSRILPTNETKCLQKSFVRWNAMSVKNLTNRQSIGPSWLMQLYWPYIYKSEWNYSRSIWKQQRRQVDVYSQCGEIPAIERTCTITRRFARTSDTSIQGVHRFR